jgi:hypothetical protein
VGAAGRGGEICDGSGSRTGATWPRVKYAEDQKRPRRVTPRGRLRPRLPASESSCFTFWLHVARNGREGRGEAGDNRLNLLLNLVARLGSNQLQGLGGYDLQERGFDPDLRVLLRAQQQSMGQPKHGIGKPVRGHVADVDTPRGKRLWCEPGAAR